eukprot:73430-Prorocentrum_minimum.AAC.1
MSSQCVLCIRICTKLSERTSASRDELLSDTRAGSRRPWGSSWAVACAQRSCIFEPTNMQTPICTTYMESQQHFDSTITSQTTTHLSANHLSKIFTSKQFLHFASPPPGC